jgi:hypothetical protein
MKEKNIEQEKGRVTAFKLERYIREENTCETVFLPQFELIKFDISIGDVISKNFVCFSDKSTKSGVAEFYNELDALKYALEHRDNLIVN